MFNTISHSYFTNFLLSSIQNPLFLKSWGANPTFFFCLFCSIFDIILILIFNFNFFTKGWVLFKLGYFRQLIAPASPAAMPTIWVVAASSTTPLATRAASAASELVAAWAEVLSATAMRWDEPPPEEGPHYAWNSAIGWDHFVFGRFHTPSVMQTASLL